MKKNQGITLIALVITIIVMLILVAVTITIAVNGGLFNYAREAGVKTNEAKDLEQNYVDLAEGLSYEDLIGVYSAELNPKGTIPTGCKYTVASTGEELEEGDKFPTTVNTEDEYETDDYIYRYNQYSDEGEWTTDEEQNGWGVYVKDYTKANYEQILYSINGKNVNTMQCTFCYCRNLIKAPVIPNNIINMVQAFQECSKLKVAPTIPAGVENMISTFNGCELLEIAPAIPKNVKYMGDTFASCSSLKGTIEINANPTEYVECFCNCAQDAAHSITLTGSASPETFSNLKGTGYNEGLYITIPE